MSKAKKMDNLDELFEHEMKDVYFAEHKLLKALEQLEKESQVAEIKEAFSHHHKQTKEHVARLDKVFKMVGTSPQSQKCPGILGLLDEKKDFAKENPTQDVLEFYNLTAAAKAERYEISAYESLINIAEKNDNGEVASLLRETLQEEMNALSTVQSLARQFDASAIAGEDPNT